MTRHISRNSRPGEAGISKPGEKRPLPPPRYTITRDNLPKIEFPRWIGPQGRPRDPISALTKDADRRARARYLSPSEMRIATEVAPNSAYIQSVRWNDFDQAYTPRDDAFPSDGEYKAVLEPHGPLAVNYSLFKGLMPGVNGLLVARILDNVTDVSHQSITMSPGISVTAGRIDLGAWLSPFPVNLFGYHQLVLDLWVESPAGQPLPADQQTNPPDNRTFVHSQTDWIWVWIDPGCVGSGGVSWCQIKKWTVTPTAIDIVNGVIGPNQVVRCDWQIDHANLPPTPFGYLGSLPETDIVLESSGLLFSTKTSPTKEMGSTNLDLSGKPYDPNHPFLDLYGGPCSLIQSVHLTPKAAKATPPDLTIVNTWIENGPGVIVPKAGDPFTVFFLVKNVGGTASNAFTVQFTLDGAQQSTLPLSGLAAGDEITVYWPFPSGLDSGPHDVDALANPDGSATESNYNNNWLPNGFYIY